MACLEALTIECQTCGREDELRRPNLADPRVAERLRACVDCGARRAHQGSRVVAGPEWYWRATHAWAASPGYDSAVCERYLLTAEQRELEAGLDAVRQVRLPFALPRYNGAPPQVMPVVVQEDGGRCLAAMSSGLAPRWAKSESQHLINARAEGLAERPALRRPLQRGRYLLATRAANAAMAPLHAYMPAILDAEARDAWLDPARADPAAQGNRPGLPEADLRPADAHGRRSSGTGGR